MRVLVTGVSGFVGRHLVDLTRRNGAELVGLARRRCPEDLEGLLDGYVAADLLDADAVSRVIAETQPNRIFHLAGEASVGVSWREPQATLENNFTASLNLLEAVRTQSSEARVLVACSGEAYGPVPPERLPVTEAEPLRPQNPYAVSKAAADLLAGFYADARGVDVVRTRAFNHCGPGQSDSFVVAAFARQIAAAEAEGHSSVTLETGDLRPRRDFTDVRDVVRGYWLALERARAGTYNVCSGASTPIADILAGLARHSTLDVEQRTDQRLVREHEVMEIRGSHDKLSGATGWEPEIALTDTLRDTLDWWRERARAEALR
jgi:GDP-4-dehydro-6-deoxy-D-mannose reductase